VVTSVGRSRPANIDSKNLGGRRDVATFRDEHIDDLAVLVDRPVHVAPHTGDLHVGFVDEPAVADTVATWPRSDDDQRAEALHPPVDGDVIDVHAAFGEEFFDISVRQSGRRYDRTAYRITSGGNR
jgi:hypothetical protein